LLVTPAAKYQIFRLCLSNPAIGKSENKRKKFTGDQIYPQSINSRGRDTSDMA